jgi:hypothetical protein
MNLNDLPREWRALRRRWRRRHSRAGLYNHYMPDQDNDPPHLIGGGGIKACASTDAIQAQSEVYSNDLEGYGAAESY